jgi:hypothetical protein
MKLGTDLLVAFSGGESPQHGQFFDGQRDVRAGS